LMEEVTAFRDGMPPGRSPKKSLSPRRNDAKRKMLSFLLGVFASWRETSSFWLLQKICGHTTGRISQTRKQSSTLLAGPRSAYNGSRVAIPGGLLGARWRLGFVLSILESVGRWSIAANPLPGVVVGDVYRRALACQWSARSQELSWHSFGLRLALSNRTKGVNCCTMLGVAAWPEEVSRFWHVTL
jgi:hypothetical protein